MPSEPAVMQQKRLRVAAPEDAARGSQALAHLLAVLDGAVRLMDECGYDVDARIVEAHRAALARGEEWPGDPVASCEVLPGGCCLTQPDA